MRSKLLSALVVIFLVACSSIDCPVQNVVAVKYALMHGEEADTLKDTVWVFSRRSDGTDTLLLNRGTGISSFSLQVSYSHPEDTLLVLLSDTTGRLTLDTVWLKKDDIPHFESVDCSAHFFHRLTAVRSTHESIDSIRIVNPTVNYDASITNLYIYFHK